jgi:hypothetical protein
VNEGKPKRSGVEILDFVAIAGVLIIFGGLWWIKHPVAVLFLGIVLFVYAYVRSRPGAG